MSKLSEVTWTPEFEETHSCYDGGDRESLTHDSIFEYLEELICDDGLGMDLDAALSENWAIEVFGYDRMKFGRPRSRLDDYIENIDEQDGIGDPDGDHDPLTQAQYRELVDLEKKLIDRLCELYEPWGCLPVVKINVPIRDWWESLTDEERTSLSE
jgi:hypothetical protein